MVRGAEERPGRVCRGWSRLVGTALVVGEYLMDPVHIPEKPDAFGGCGISRAPFRRSERGDVYYGRVIGYPGWLPVAATE